MKDEFEFHFDNQMDNFKKPGERKRRKRGSKSNRISGLKVAVLVLFLISITLGVTCIFQYRKYHETKRVNEKWEEINQNAIVDGAKTSFSNVPP